MIRRTNFFLLFWIGLASSFSACVNTTRLAPEYAQPYYLAEDVHLYQSYSFTGTNSLWFSGPEKVDTICSAKIPVKGASTIQKGSAVKIVKLFQTAAIDSSSSEAKLEIVDRNTKAIHVVYVKWPGSKSLLAPATP